MFGDLLTRPGRAAGAWAVGRLLEVFGCGTVVAVALRNVPSSCPEPDAHPARLRDSLSTALMPLPDWQPIFIRGQAMQGDGPRVRACQSRSVILHVLMQHVTVRTLKVLEDSKIGPFKGAAAIIGSCLRSRVMRTMTGVGTLFSSIDASRSRCVVPGPCFYNDSRENASVSPISQEADRLVMNMKEILRCVPQGQVGSCRYLPCIAGQPNLASTR